MSYTNLAIHHEAYIWTYYIMNAWAIDLFVINFEWNRGDGESSQEWENMKVSLERSKTTLIQKQDCALKVLQAFPNWKRWQHQLKLPPKWKRSRQHSQHITNCYNIKGVTPCIIEVEALECRFPCRLLAHHILDNNELEVFACSYAQATIQPQYGGPLECGGQWTQDDRLPCVHYMILNLKVLVTKGLRPIDDSRKPCWSRTPSLIAGRRR